MAIVERSEYKGKAMLVIKRKEDDQYPFQFGRAKAKLIIENLAAIAEFADEKDEQKAGE